MEFTAVIRYMQAGDHTYDSIVTDNVPTWLIVTFYVVVGSTAALAFLRWFVKDAIKGAKWFINVNEHIKDTNTHIKETNTAIVEIRRNLSRVLLMLFPGDSAFEGASPLRLTDMGKAIADELDVDAWVQKTVPTIRERVRGEPPDAIEEICFEFIIYGDEFQPGTDLLNKIRASAYQHGIAKEQVRGVLAIVLRDELIKLEEAETSNDDRSASAGEAS